MNSLKDNLERHSHLKRRACLYREYYLKSLNDVSIFANYIRSPGFNATSAELLMTDCLEWLSKNYSLKVKIPLMSRELNLSVRKIQRLFTYFLNSTFSDVLCDIRIEQSKKYLQLQDVELVHVVKSVGFKTPAYFSHIFRRKTGMTPSQYRSTLLSMSESY